MSYGRDPYYIYSMRLGDVDGFSFLLPNVFEGGLFIPYDAMAQFIASMATRGDDELSELVERGKELRPEINPDLRVVIENPGWRT